MLEGGKGDGSYARVLQSVGRGTRGWDTVKSPPPPHTHTFFSDLILVASRHANINMFSSVWVW